MKRIVFVMLSLLVFLCAAPGSEAAVQAVSPLNGPDGFPLWYEDANGLRLAPCLGNVAFCGLDVAARPPGPGDPGFNPANPVSFPGNYPSEMFYWSAGADLLVGPGGTGRAVLVLALEGAFAGGEIPTAGEQMTFSRIQVGPVANLVPGATYTVTHPFGTFQITADPVTGIAPRFRDEFGCAPVPPVVPCDFTLALGTFAPFPTVGPFLRQLVPPPPAGFIGDGGSLSPITPGPNGAVFSITGSNVGGIGVNTISTNLFTITGQIFSLPTDEIGLFRNGQFILDSNGDRIFESLIDRVIPSFGLAGDVPVAGDWDGLGAIHIGIFRNGLWALDLNNDGLFQQPGDAVFVFGQAGDIPVTGKWVAGPAMRIGLFRDGQWILDVNGNGTFESGIDAVFFYGQAGDIPVTGDWNGDGVTDIGLFRDGQFILDTNGTRAFEFPGDAVFFYGQAGDIPVAGDWTGDNISEIGLFRNGQWILDLNGNRTFELPGDVVFVYGQLGDQPITGKW